MSIRIPSEKFIVYGLHKYCKNKGEKDFFIIFSTMDKKFHHAFLVRKIAVTYCWWENDSRSYRRATDFQQ